MMFWKKLFRKRTSGQPATPPESIESMDDEIRRLDAIDAIDPKTRKEDYWRTLHPLVQAYWIYRVGGEHEDEVPISRSDASSVFHRWGYSVGSYTFQISPRQKELMTRYDSCKEMLWQQCQEADQRFRQIEAEAEENKKQAWQTYWQHYETLPAGLQSLVAWELAKRGASQGRSGFHGGMGVSLPFPFSPCGWASYEEPVWGAAEGVAFRVNRACFGDRKPLLYYLDDDNWPSEDREKEYLAIIERYSSGISGVRAERRRCRGWDGEEKERRVVLFEPDPTAVKKTVRLSGEAVSTKILGEYVFVLPRAGEFYCLLGEVRDGEMIPLHKDDFCMK